MSSRDAILDAAAELVVAHGYRRLRMQDVGDRAGVSRQTVYNEFRDKDGLAQAVILRETARLLDGIDAAIRAQNEPSGAVHAAVAYVLGAGTDNPLVKTVLAGDGAEGLLPLLTTRGKPVLHLAAQRTAAVLRNRWSVPHADLVAETAVRLTVSHLMLPLDPADRAATKVTRAVTALLRSQR